MPILCSQLLPLWGSSMTRHVHIKELDLRNVHTNTVADRMNAVPGFKTSAG